MRPNMPRWTDSVITSGNSGQKRRRATLLRVVLCSLILVQSGVQGLASDTQGLGGIGLVAAETFQSFQRFTTRSTQDAAQSVHPVEHAWCFQQDCR